MQQVYGILDDYEECEGGPTKQAFIMGEDGLVRHFEGHWDDRGNTYGGFPKILGTFRVGKKSETKPSGKISCMPLSEDYRGFTLKDDEVLIRVPDDYKPKITE